MLSTRDSNEDSSRAKRHPLRAPLVSRITALCLVSAAAVVTTGCSYDAPPEVSLVAPEGGAFRLGDALHIAFSEPVRPESLAVRVWPENRDVEGLLPPDAVPALPLCRATDPSCSGATLELSPDGDSAILSLESAGLGRPDVPWILEVTKGLSDETGHRTGRPIYFDFQFIPAPPDSSDDGDTVPFEDGHYVLVGSMDDPMPVVLTYISEILTLPDGRIALAGAEGDEIDGAPKNTIVPEELFVDESDEGYTVYAFGQLVWDDGERFLATEPFPIDVWVGPLLVEIKGMRIFAKITRRDGHDLLEGTFSFDGVTLHIGEDVHDYAGGSTALIGVYVPPGTCESGAPQVCGDLCGAVIGQCNPPSPFPPGDFCAQYESLGLDPAE